jgi:hypothetical protein
VAGLTALLQDRNHVFIKRDLLTVGCYHGPCCNENQNESPHKELFYKEFTEPGCTPERIGYII